MQPVPDRETLAGQTRTLGVNDEVRIEELAEHPVDWWGGHRDALADERGRIPLSFSIVGRLDRDRR